MNKSVHKYSSEVGGFQNPMNAEDQFKKKKTMYIYFRFD